MSFVDAILVLLISNTVEEMGKESGFLTNKPTVACSALEKGSMQGFGIVQVYPRGGCITSSLGASHSIPPSSNLHPPRSRCRRSDSTSRQDASRPMPTPHSPRLPSL